MAGALAQLVERLVRNEKVRGSTPLSSTKNFAAGSFSGVSYYIFPLFHKKNNGVILCRLPDFFHVQQ